MTFLSPQIEKIGLRFGPPEFFALAFFGLGMIVTIYRIKKAQDKEEEAARESDEN